MSRKLRGFQIGAVGSGFVDTFNNSSIHSDWTVDITDVSGDDPTITEDGTGLTISYVGGNSVFLTWPLEVAPNINIPLNRNQDFMVKVFVDNFTVDTQRGSVGIAHYLDGDKTQCHTMSLRDHGGGDFFEVGYNDSDYTTHALGSPSGEAWMAMLRRGYYMHFLYSLNAFGSEPALKDMTHVRVFQHAFDYADSRVALYAESSTVGFPAISPRFRKFSLTYSV